MAALYIMHRNVSYSLSIGRPITASVIDIIIYEYDVVG